MEMLFGIAPADFHELREFREFRELREFREFQDRSVVAGSLPGSPPVTPS